MIWSENDIICYIAEGGKEHRFTSGYFTLVPTPADVYSLTEVSTKCCNPSNILIDYDILYGFEFYAIELVSNFQSLVDHLLIAYAFKITNMSHLFFTRRKKKDLITLT